MEEVWILSDAHAHVGTKREWEERKRAGILSLLCGVSPEEAGKLIEECGIWDVKQGGVCGENRYLLPTCGIHPWYADRYELKDMERWMELCPVIGEIGMDSVWCDVDLKVQEDRFRQQLWWACERNKPVILHTKGQEKEIADIIKEYPNRYLVHWYSCDDYLEEYLALDCYFSIGPDVWWNRAVQKVARSVPIDRILMETDGLDAVKWAYEEGRKASEAKVVGDIEMCQGAEQVNAALANTLKTVARIREMPPAELGRQTKENLIHFLKK